MSNTSDEYGQVSCYLAKVIVGYVSFQIFDLPKLVPPSKMYYYMILKIRKIIIYNNIQRVCLFYEENDNDENDVVFQ